MHCRVDKFAAFVHTYFGAPGHGKGPWDRIGAWWKNKVNQCSSLSKVQGRLGYTQSDYIESVTDVWMALRYHFDRTTQWNVQLAGRNPINGYQFFLYT